MCLAPYKRVCLVYFGFLDFDVKSCNLLDYHRKCMRSRFSTYIMYLASYFESVRLPAILVNIMELSCSFSKVKFKTIFYFSRKTTETTWNVKFLIYYLGCCKSSDKKRYA